MEDVIVHNCDNASYACNYRQGEALKLKRPYVAPVVEVLEARVEGGFAGSGNRTLYLGSSEEVTSNGGIHSGNGAPSDNGSNMEGLGDGGHLYF